jgi:hypothetical protein
MDSRERSVGELLREAFLRGEKVSAPEFAEQIGGTRAGISSAMKQFGPMVKACRIAGMGNALHWECVDMDAMKQWVPKPRYVPRKERQQPAVAPNDLMQVWGMRAVDIALPYQRHSMTMDDDLEEAA